MSELTYFVKNKFVRNVLVLVFVFTVIVRLWRDSGSAQFRSVVFWRSVVILTASC